MHCISINYRRVPQSVRARFAFTTEQQESFLNTAAERIDEVTQCVVLSTCNRCELYFDGSHSVIRSMAALLCEVKKVSLAQTLSSLDVYEGERSVHHLTKLACGIESAILGEDEILRQLKEAYAVSLEAGFTAFEFNTIFQMAFNAAKAIKTETGLSMTPVSYGTLAAHEVFDFHPGEEKTVLVIGATGKIGSITAKNIAVDPKIRVLGTVRSASHIDREQWRTDAVEEVLFADRYTYIEDADIVISATSSPHYTVTRDEYENRIRNKKERLFLDLSIPSDLDSELQEVPEITFRDIDWFQKKAEDNNRLKKEKAEIAAEDADRYAEEILKELTLHRLIAAIPQLTEAVEEKGLDHLIFSLRDTADKEQVEAVSKWLFAFLNRTEE